MTQPKKSGSRSTSSRAGSAAKRSSASSTTSRSRTGTGPAGGGARSTASRPATAPSRASSGPEANIEAATERIRALNERIIDGGKRVSIVALDVYEATLKGIADTLDRGPGSSDIEWISRVAGAQADFLRELTKTLTGPARDALK